ncbi:hypothetical protein [Marinomonas mediterranea]|jgi:hypothetical protein|uniref:Uncharacterized protein n=1 Tax=Marinomonas mediterranea (strain ATCC 700492 / JCM 21426 / NBRC 103028 / MMB-1) TaxID=717774 RepID=F2JVF0_MARM1|nr:hypothetical protein [Marinomonas mediterranea]ADZ89408.1 hypothetical protein Marme_0102 [Marinomonas mediterranea MMB-1]WCN07502.1 hypothetical protein GV055_00500 [Marinomonas mediterranea]WCN11602.1 hypothetical protein GV054_00515 [Marinomonas mediterranea]WCN15666.1 hypothetical protein GV053_00500 [Marinomonas mediterranea MMB-1]
MMDKNLALIPPKKWKMMVVVWLAIYPLLNLFFPLFDIAFPYLSAMAGVAQFNLPIRLLLMTIVIVPIMSTIMALLQKRLFVWLRS